MSSPLSLLGIYGLVGGVAGFGSPNIFYATYWSVAFLAAIVTARLASRNTFPVASSVQLLGITWLATALVVVLVWRTAGDTIFGSSASGYGIITDLNGVSRSSGVARWAAVIGLVLIVAAVNSHSWLLTSTCATGAALSFFVVYRMQSRGAVLGTVAALISLLYFSRRIRTWALPSACFLLIVVWIVGVDSDTITNVVEYLKRGGGEEGLYTMGGRTNYYALGWDAFLDSPWLGRGQWADRLLLIGHIHNSFLQALLNAGVLGFVPYLISWIIAWKLFWKLWKNSGVMPRLQRTVLEQCGVVMLFFTVRAIPETTTASFAPDLLIMCAVYAVLESMTTTRLQISMLARKVARPVVANSW